jgi:hypothetical protein
MKLFLNDFYTPTEFNGNFWQVEKLIIEQKLMQSKYFDYNRNFLHIR